MRNILRIFSAAAVLFLAASSTALGEGASAVLEPEFQEAAFFGGSGNQGAAQNGMGSALTASKLYVSGADMSLLGGQSMLAVYNLPAGGSPASVLKWPNKPHSGNYNEEAFPGVAVTSEGIYCAGRSLTQTTDSIGGKEHKSVLVKFPLSGAGTGVGGSLWVAKTLFFPYSGHESFMSVTAVQEAGGTFLYATGRAQPTGSSNTAVLAKFDTSGKLIWKKVLGRVGMYVWSEGGAVASLNGHIYVSGFTHWHNDMSGMGLSNPIRPHMGLWKLDAAGNLIWFKESVQPIVQNSIHPVTCATDGQFIYATAGQEKAPNGGYDVLVLKYDQAGNVVSSFLWGTAKDEVSTSIAVSGRYLYVTGWTEGWKGGGRDLFLLPIDLVTGKNGTPQFYGGEKDDIGWSVRVSGKEVYVTGHSSSFEEGTNMVGSFDAMVLRYLLKPKITIIPVTMDIRPGETPNPINLKSGGKVPVAILSTKTFSAPALVDVESVTFGRTGNEKSLADKGNQGKPQDINGDGLPDLLFHFETKLAGFVSTDAQGVLKAKTLQGELLMGADSIKIVPQKVLPRQVSPAAAKPAPARRAVVQPAKPAAASTTPAKRAPAPVTNIQSGKGTLTVQYSPGVTATIKKR